MKEDSKDLEGSAARVEKTKKKKKLTEVSSKTLSSYIEKARKHDFEGMDANTNLKRFVMLNKARKKLAKKSTNEAVGKEFTANLQLSAEKGIKRSGPGHYIKNGNKVVSGPHGSASDALAAYKNLDTSKQQGSKIVKESSDKYKKVVEKILLNKKAKSNKHVDTKPTLDIQDRGVPGPIEASE